MKHWAAIAALMACLYAGAEVTQEQHPRLLLTVTGVQAMREGQGKSVLFDAELARARARVEGALAAPIVVPMPKDAAGFTHERHKANYVEMQLAGLFYQLTEEARFAGFVAEMLEGYAALYPTLGDHPAGTSSSPGRLFHQSLNEAVWLVHATQAYDCIYEALTDAQRSRFESRVFRPMARFLLKERAHEFDRIHNHGTWAATAVGMAGYVLGDDALVEAALYGSQRDGKGGYLAQLDHLFSPNGYYVEGPYYARYALWPFFVFAQVIETRQPELRIFERRDGLLGKAVDSLLQLTNEETGAFIPFNDALKEKAHDSPEVQLAVALTYSHYGRDARLLDVARRQGGVTLLPEGLEVAQALERHETPPPYAYLSVEYRDGPEGERGGVGLLRAVSGGERQSLALLKYTSFGMEHGHYDKLGLIYYDQGREVLQDYGSARFLNVEQKRGGRYLPENRTWAKQTLAHNALVVDRQSHYNGGHYEEAEHAHSQRHFFEASDPDFQIVSARDTTAVKDVAIQRTVALIRDSRLEFPILVDVLQTRAADGREHDYDLPLWYQGQFLQTNLELEMQTEQRRPLGAAQGYEHLWLEGEGNAAVGGSVQFTWMNGERFYTATSTNTAPVGLSLLLVRLGANDPNLNLRAEPGFVLRTRAADSVFATVIEPHGLWDGAREFTRGSFPSVDSVHVVAATDEGTVVRLSGTGCDGTRFALTVMVSNHEADDPEAARRVVATDGSVYEWRGNAALLRE